MTLLHGVGEYALQPSYTKYTCTGRLLEATLKFEIN